MSNHDVTTPGRRVGRPSIKDQRQREIVWAFIQLVAERGLEHVALDDVAAEAGVQRAALRHFVGNREDLISAAIAKITRRALADIDVQFNVAQVIAMLFDPSRMKSADVYDRAWTELLPEAMRSPDTHAVVKESYDHLISLISNALRQGYPKASRSQIADTAYAIACMAEHNYTFQRLGYPQARVKGLKETAFALADRLD
jgi:TetR/AcrR family transcriptional regulator, transcriptional repressor of bet genes